MKLETQISNALQYATDMTGLSDWSNFIIVVNEFELEVAAQLCGLPVYVIPMRTLGYAFTLAYPYDVDEHRQDAMCAVLEYQHGRGV